jgi:hypothetical protein
MEPNSTTPVDPVVEAPDATTSEQQLIQKQHLEEHLKKIISSGDATIENLRLLNTEAFKEPKKRLLFCSAMPDRLLKTKGLSYLPELQIILDKNKVEDLNVEDEQGMTFLIVASIQGNVDAIDKLIRHIVIKTDSAAEGLKFINHVSTKGYTQGLTALSAAKLFEQTYTVIYLEEIINFYEAQTAPKQNIINRVRSTFAGLFGKKGGKRTSKKSRKSRNQKKRVKSRRTKK